MKERTTPYVEKKDKYCSTCILSCGSQGDSRSTDISHTYTHTDIYLLLFEKNYFEKENLDKSIHREQITFKQVTRVKVEYIESIKPIENKDTG